MDRLFALRRILRRRGTRHGWPWLSILPLVAGCYAPLFSHGIPARQLPDEFRMPIRTAGLPINYASLTQPAPPDYRLGAGDVLEVTLPELIRVDNQAPRGGQAHALRAQVMASGEVQLPLIGPVNVRDMNLLQAQNAIIAAYRNKGIGPERSDLPVNVFLAQKATISVVVLGAVNTPGVHVLPKYENDVGHALAAAGGFNDDADDKIEVHRRAHGALPPGAAPLPGAPTLPARRSCLARRPHPPPGPSSRPRGSPHRLRRGPPRRQKPPPA